LEIEEDFTFRVLDEEGGHAATGKVAKLVGRRLIAQVSEYMKPDTCVRINCDDALVLGETLGCWREGSVTFAAVELLQALTGLEKLARFQERDWDSAQPIVTQIRRRA
jgi:RNA 3'-terminal phosphate cyclase